ncbi:MAG TPA: Gfo/Idh/MocA family oxidoreductase [Candidatus Limnocylindrales bacterium]
MATRVALVGANGHGRHHRRHIESLGSSTKLVGLCDVQPVDDVPDGVGVYTDLAEMLKATEPEVVIVCTPPRTHLPFALSALEFGADVLLEKPPVLDLSEHDTLAAAIERTGRVVQVGFQGLGSSQLPALRALPPGDISIIGAWQRDDVYWGRSPWAGRLPLDGALRNPFAHYTMQALAIEGSEPVHLEVAWCRLRDIEVDDTSTLRLTLADGRRVLIAVTLAGEDMIDGEIRVGQREFRFRELVDRSLLLNLVGFRSRNEPLLAPLSATRGFTAIVEALGRMPMPGRLDESAFSIEGPVRTLPGVNAVLRRCAEDFALLSEIDAPWTATATGGAANIG